MVHTSLIEDVSHQVSKDGDVGEELTSCMVKSGNWSKCSEKIQSLSPITGILLGQIVEHLGRALGVTDIRNFGGASLVSNKVDHGGIVMVTHLGPAELPESEVFVWIELSMTETVFGASLVTEPDIITSSHKLEGWCNIWIVHDPAIC